MFTVNEASGLGEQRLPNKFAHIILFTWGLVHKTFGKWIYPFGKSFMHQTPEWQ